MRCLPRENCRYWIFWWREMSYRLRPFVLPTPRVSLRAITSASLFALDPPEFCRAERVHDYWTFLIAQCFKQMARVNIHQLKIGRLETEPRVASFVLALALRSVREDTPRITVALPMSRNDIANYLVINCDTLSRTMMRFCDCGLQARSPPWAYRERKRVFYFSPRKPLRHFTSRNNRSIITFQCGTS